MPVRSARILSCSASFERRRRTANRTRRRVARRPAAIAHRVPAATSSQRYEKSSAEASVSLIMPRRSIFGIGQRYEKVGRRSKRQLDSTETEYLRRSQRYEKVGRESKFICILPGASIRGVSQRRMSRRQKQARSHFVRRAYLRRCLNNGEIGKIGCSDEKNGIILLCRRAWFVVFRQNRKATARSRRRISSAAG